MSEDFKVLCLMAGGFYAKIYKVPTEELADILRALCPDVKIEVEGENLIVVNGFIWPKTFAISAALRSSRAPTATWRNFFYELIRRGYLPKELEPDVEKYVQWLEEIGWRK